jgi:hypothetical protein
VPQDRRRIFIVAIRADSLANEFLWPLPHASCPPLDTFLGRADPWMPFPPQGTRHHARLIHVLDKLANEGVNAFASPTTVDVGASDTWCKPKAGVAMCLTKTSCAARRYWLTTKGGYLEADDMELLHGIMPGTIQWQEAGVSAVQYRGMLGNAISMNVLKELVPRVMYSAGLITMAQLKRMTPPGIREV